MDDVMALRMHRLGLWSPSATTAGEAVEQLVAVQAQEHAYARWSVAQRMALPAPAADIDRAFDAGDLLRTHVLRPTWHYVAPGDLRWLMRLSGPRVHAWNARRYAELELAPREMQRSLDLIAAAVAERPLTRPEIGGVLTGNGIDASGQRLAYLVMHAELHAVVCSGPMRGRQHTYALFDERVPAAPGPDGDEALAQLATRYFRTRGPATVKDFAWWAGFKMGDARRAVAEAGDALETIDLEGRTYLVAVDVSDPPHIAAGERADLVQCYDEAIISYTESRDVLRADGVSFRVPATIDGFTHVVLLDGHLFGHWRVMKGRRRGDDDVEVRLPPDATASERDAVDEARERFLCWSAGRATGTSVEGRPG